MGESSIISAFNFVSYKVLRFNINSVKSIELISNNEPLGPWAFNIVITQPAYSKKHQTYACGIVLSGKLSVTIPDNSVVDIITFESEIAGTFKVDGQFEKSIEDNLVKIQAPALLMPYLRGTITSYFANAGFGSIKIPLINIHNIAKTALAEIEIQVVD